MIDKITIWKHPTIKNTDFYSSGDSDTICTSCGYRRGKHGTSRDMKYTFCVANNASKYDNGLIKASDIFREGVKLRKKRKWTLT